MTVTPYGIGTMILAGAYPGSSGEVSSGMHTKTGTVADEHKALLIGHGGEDYGSSSPLCGYNPYFDFGICLEKNFAMFGMNCSNTKEWARNLLEGSSACELYSTLLTGVGGPEMDCPNTATVPTPRLPWNVTGCTWSYDPA